MSLAPIYIQDPNNSGHGYILLPFSGNADLTDFFNNNPSITVPSIGGNDLTQAFGVFFEVYDSQWTFVEEVVERGGGVFSKQFKFLGQFGTVYSAGVVLVDASLALEYGGDVKRILVEGGYSIAGGLAATWAGGQLGAGAGLIVSPWTGPWAPVVEAAFIAGGGLAGGLAYGYSGISDWLTDLTLGEVPQQSNINLEIIVPGVVWDSLGIPVTEGMTQGEIAAALNELESYPFAFFDLTTSSDIGGTNTTNAISIPGIDPDTGDYIGAYSYSQFSTDANGNKTINGVSVVPGLEPETPNTLQYSLSQQSANPNVTMTDLSVGGVPVVDEAMKDGLLKTASGLAWSMLKGNVDPGLADFINGGDPNLSTTYELQPDGTYIPVTRDQDGNLVAKVKFTGNTYVRDTFSGDVSIAETYQNGVHDVAVRIGDSLISFGQIGSILGSNLGRLIAGDDPFEQALAGTFFGVVGKNLMQTAGFLLDGNELSTALDKAAGDLGLDLKTAAIGAVSSLLVAELVNALGVDGVAGELLNATGGQALGMIANNLVHLGEALEGGGEVAWNTGLDNLDFTTLLASYVGSKLASEVISFGSVGGQVGSAIGSAAAGYALAQWGAQLGLVGGPLGAAIGAFVGYILGGAIGSIFGGTPRSAADVSFDPETGEFYVSGAWSKKGGSKDAARGLAQAAADTINNVVLSIGGSVLNGDEVKAGTYGMRKDYYTYRDEPSVTHGKSDIDRKFYGDTGAEQLIEYGVLNALDDLMIAGGNIYMKRALSATLSTILNGDNVAVDDALQTLTGDLTFAADYGRYIANRQVVNAIIAAAPDSAFTAGWIITLQRAEELQLNRRYASDWYGGWNTFLAERNALPSGVQHTYQNGERLMTITDVNGAQWLERDTLTAANDNGGMCIGEAA